MSYKKYTITLTKMIHESDVDFEEKRIIDLIQPESLSIKVSTNNKLVETLDTFINDYAEGWVKSGDEWTKTKGNVIFNIYRSITLDKFSWKVKINNANIDYTILNRGYADTINEAMKLCNETYVNRSRHF